MTKSEIKINDVIHCKNPKEFNRIMDLFEMDKEYMMWDVYEEDTVLFPFDKQYGAIDGYCEEEKMNVIDSTNITLE